MGFSKGILCVFWWGEEAFDLSIVASTPSPRIRFAPNPSGPLHLGNARTSLVVWLYARAKGLRFDLRFDDDPAPYAHRDLTEAGKREGDIIDDLYWLGLNWDSCYRLSERAGLALWVADNCPRYF